MAGVVNIGVGNQDDAFYRYKMPKLITKVEGRGNGIRTNLVNMTDVAKALARPASYTTKFFGCELGAQSKHDEKTGVSIVNGAHETAKLTNLLEGFIKRFVQCYACGNPETVVNIDKAQNIQLLCKACGAVSPVDMRHKLTTYILKNPPESKGGKDKASKQLRKAEKERIKAGEAIDAEEKAKKKLGKSKSKKEKKTGDDDEVESPTGPGPRVPDVEDGDDEVEWATDTSASAVKQRMQEQLTEVTSNMVTAGNGVIDEEPTTINAKKAANGSGTPKTPKKEKKKEKSPEPEPEEEEEEAVDEVAALSLHDKLVSDLKSYMEDHDVAATTKYLAGEADSAEEQAIALFEALFGDSAKTLSKSVSKKLPFLAAFAKGGKDAQRALLAAIEVFTGVTFPAAKKDVALVLKKLYDSDAVEEEVILEWYDAGAGCNADVGVPKAVGVVVREQAKPFVDWLREAEEESDEDEE
ncbi:Translation initiation factor 5 [Klebsormidium nitens]|uniref:Translation initiation factor 5 n=1 Tax=Klebsormidium nitens TaxID=105231 RepID=A0A1Y1ITM5_KLENI|nr:Translation initiation factor 5 [Klebsormidium nitens]|eukprot:GAQ92007.1 Translation initiation factor 5 [Klebsormidium nitens]